MMAEYIISTWTFDYFKNNHAMLFVSDSGISCIVDAFQNDHMAILLHCCFFVEGLVNLRQPKLLG